MPVVDASVIVAAFKADDVGHEASSAWLRAALLDGSGVAAPVLLLAEVGAAVRRSTGDIELGGAVLAELRRMPELRLVPVADALARRAAEIAVAHALRGCDAIYVALAEHLGVPLVTLDDEMLERGAAVVRTVRPSATRRGDE